MRLVSDDGEPLSVEQLKSHGDEVGLLHVETVEVSGD